MGASSIPPLPTSPAQLTSNQLWFPPNDPTLSQQTNNTLRQILYEVYQISSGLLSIGVQATGTKQVVIPNANNAYAQVPGCSITFPRQGLWLVTGVFSIQVLDAGDENFNIYGALLVSGLQQQSSGNNNVMPPATQSAKAYLKVQGQPTTVNIAQTWSFRANQNGVARLMVQKDKSATGTHTLCDGPNSTIAGVWCGL
jgi:hypothetical protein